MAFLITACKPSLPSNKVIEMKEENSKTITLNNDFPICFSTKEIQKLDTSLLKTALKKIAKIPEVDSLDVNEKRFCYSETVKENQLYFVIQVYLEKETHFSGQYKFYFNKKTQEIKIEDFISNTVISMNEFRKRKL